MHCWCMRVRAARCAHMVHHMTIYLYARGQSIDSTVETLQSNYLTFMPCSIVHAVHSMHAASRMRVFRDAYSTKAATPRAPRLGWHCSAVTRG